MGNGFEISKDTWDHMPPEQRDWIMFETMQRMNSRLAKLESKKWINSGCAVIGGAIGGFLFSLLKSVGFK